MKHLLLALSCALLLVNGEAQINYYFSTFTESYGDLENPTSAIDVTWDDPDITIPLGFEVNIMGTTTEEVHLSSDFLGGTLVLDLFSPSWDMLWVTSADLTDAGYFDDEHLSEINYMTAGEPGARICKIEWKNSAFYNELSEMGTANNLISLQCWIYETSGDIEVHFGPNSIKEPQYILEDWFSTGLLDNANPDNTFDAGIFLGGSGSDPSVFTGSTTDDFFLASLVSIPENGRVYRFSTEPVTVVESSDVSWKVFPSCTQDIITLQTGIAGSSFYIFDLEGRVVQEGRLNMQESVSMAHLHTGIYLVRLSAGGKTKTFRVVKE